MIVHKTTPLPFANHTDSAIKERPATVLATLRGPNHATLVSEGLLMAHEANNARNDSAQDFIDPIISNARLVNLAAEIERNLAMRKALRPMRSEAARKGWEVRNAR